MKLLFLVLLFCLVSFSTAARSTAAAAAAATVTTKTATPLPVGNTRFERFIHKIFDDADTNKDDSVSFGEAYELVLKIYVNINRQAPIPPPTRRKVLQLYLDADTSQNDRLSREEFTGLAKTLGRRALSRVVAHKIVTLVGAPFLAHHLVISLAKVEWLPSVAAAVVPDQWEEKILPVLTSRSFCQTILIVLSVATLGNIVMSTLNMALDISLPDEEEDPRLKKYIP